MKHWPFGGSTAARTLHCPAWRQLSDGIPDSVSEHALRGTAQHDIMEQMLLGDVDDPNELLGLTIAGVIVDEDMLEQVTEAWDAWQQLVKQYGVEEWEPEVVSEHNDQIGGSADIIARGEGVTIVADWKFGKGHLVSPVESSQGMFYAWVAQQNPMAEDLFEGNERIVIAIIQPSFREQTLKTWETTAERIDLFGKQFLRAVKAAQGEDPIPSMGDHCTFCRAEFLCPAKTGAAHAALEMDPGQLESLQDAMDLVGDLKSWIRAVEGKAYDTLTQGQPLTGWKLVAKRAVEKWTDEEAAIAALRRRLGGIRHITHTKILTPAQMRKLAKERGKEIVLDEWVEKRSSGTTLAPEADKRPEVLSPQMFSEALNRIK